MRIAVTYENGQIFPHFGRTEQFKLYDVDNGAVTASQVIGTNGNGHGALAGFLRAQGVEALICGGIGGGAQGRYPGKAGAGPGDLGPGGGGDHPLRRGLRQCRRGGAGPPGRKLEL